MLTLSGTRVTVGRSWIKVRSSASEFHWYSPVRCSGRLVASATEEEIFEILGNYQCFTMGSSMTRNCLLGVPWQTPQERDRT